MTDVVVVIADTPIDTPVLVTEGGKEGPPGKPGITVSSTPPLNPAINDLWLEIP